MSAEASVSLKRLFARFQALGVLLVGFVLTGITTHYASERAREDFLARFSDQAEALLSEVGSRIGTSVSLLSGVQALFAVDDDVTSEEFRDYVTALDIPREYPGMQGVGFAPRVVDGEASAFAYRIWPMDPARPEYFPVKYLEPFDWRNRRAVGFDMFSDPVRRSAMEKARDTGEAMLTGPLHLVQETKESRQSGFLLYLPVYGRDLPVDTVEHRRLALKGFVYSPFRAQDFFESVLGKLGDLQHFVGFEIKDERSQALLYRHAGGRVNTRPGQEPEESRLTKVPVAGRTWDVEIHSLPLLEQQSSGNSVLWLALSGALVSALLAWVVFRNRVVADKLAVAFAQERKAVRAREQVLAVVSHDLKNPLVAIRLNAGLVKQPSLPRDTLLRAADVIEKSSDRMHRLIEDLLDMVRIEAGNLKLSLQAVSSRELLAETIELHQSIAAKQGVELKWATPAPESWPWVSCDRHRILQVLSNLVGNAIKFTPSGGSVQVGAESDGPFARLWVEDTGPGISAEELANVFNRYWQAEKTASLGTGLGLSIVRGLVRAHGGVVRAESRMGYGSRFWFTLPVAEAPAQSAPRGLPPEVGDEKTA